jgi:uncharacterized protein
MEVASMPQIDERKKKIVSDVIRRLHQGLPAEEAKAVIQREVGKLTSAEITGIEQSMIDDGVPADEIRRFCNVHALLFESALEESVKSPDSPAHPVNRLKAENKAIAELVSQVRAAADGGNLAAVEAGLKRLSGVTAHYAIKENALFPHLERHGFSGPSKVMWAKHDEVRALLKKVLAGPPSAGDLKALLDEVQGMIFKEESILYPAALERLEASEWMEVLRSCEQIGFPFIDGLDVHQDLPDTAGVPPAAPAAMPAASAPPVEAVAGDITLPTGRFSVRELEAFLNTLPMDITFVDAEDQVRYFSQGKDRIFVRATSVIGRKVQNCHPPASVDKVIRIVEDFRSGKRDHADFWITLNGRFVHIRYFAVRDAGGTYLGTLEVTQDLTDLKGLSGERRLLDD